MMELSTVRELRNDFKTSSWAIWSDDFPMRGCIEESPDRLVEFIEDNRDKLRTDVVFLGLNPSTSDQSSGANQYSNFHSPKLQHRDLDLRVAVEESSLVGALIVDISTAQTPDSSEIGPDDVDIDHLYRLRQCLPADSVHFICFGRRGFNLLKQTWGVTYEELDHNVWRMATPPDRFDAEWYSVYHYSQSDGTYTDQLREQLRYLQTEVIS